MLQKYIGACFALAASGIRDIGTEADWRLGVYEQPWSGVRMPNDETTESVIWVDPSPLDSWWDRVMNQSLVASGDRS